MIIVLVAVAIPSAMIGFETGREVTATTGAFVMRLFRGKKS
jgi:hypothetical protein